MRHAFEISPFLSAAFLIPALVSAAPDRNLPTPPPPSWEKAGRPARPVVLNAPAGAAAAAADWPCFRGPNHDGKSSDQGLLTEWPAGGPEKLWQVDGLGKGFSSVAVCGKSIYITGEQGGALTLFAFDLDGRPLWKADAGGICKNVDGARASPTVDDQRVYLLSGDGQLGCFNARDGSRVWKRTASEFGGRPGGWGYAESVLIQGKNAIFKPGGAKCIVALDKDSGREVWTSSGFSAGPEYGCCLPVNHAGPAMIVTGTHDGLVSVNAANGELLWQNEFCAGNTANCPTPAYSDGYVFWANGYGKGGVCVKLESGGKAREAWTTRDMICHHGGYVIHEGHIYGNHEGGYACLDLKSGDKKWFERAVGKGSLCWADNMLYLFSESGGQAALATCSPQGLVIKGRVKVEGSGPSWAHPVVTGGRLYLRYDDHLYCFNLRSR